MLKPFRAVTLALFVASFVALPAAPHAQSAVAPDADPRVQGLVAAVSETRLRALATTLVAFGTRESLSTTASPTRGIGAIRIAAWRRGRRHPSAVV
ncbi:MAG: hypothetical protein ABL982_26295 [Vicinamibacterales bacterium]